MSLIALDQEERESEYYSSLLPERLPLRARQGFTIVSTPFFSFTMYFFATLQLTAVAMPLDVTNETNETHKGGSPGERVPPVGPLWG